MTIKLSTAVRNIRLDGTETYISTSPVLKIRSGSPPANCAAADSGTVLATLNLPSDWMASATAGAKSKSGTWSDTSADNAGTAGHFRIYDFGGVCHIQGTCGTSGADMILDSVTFLAGQVFTVISFTLTDNNG
jgi:hypothetical protein